MGKTVTVVTAANKIKNAVTKPGDKKPAEEVKEGTEKPVLSKKPSYPVS
jgi:hypothetical protein